MSYKSEVLYMGIMVAGIISGYKGLDMYQNMPEKPNVIQYETHKSFVRALENHKGENAGSWSLMGLGVSSIILAGLGFRSERLKELETRDDGE